MATFEETIAGHPFFALWSASAVPGKVCSGTEQLRTPERDDVLRLTDVSFPGMYYFPAPGASSPAPLMIVCPGGGYSILAWNKEGTEIAEYLNGVGMSAMVLKYRVPGNREGAYMDVQRAVRLVRARASELGVDPQRIGVMGFSAGGHLSAMCATGALRPSYEGRDEIDEVSPLPNFAVLVYPAYLEAEGSLARDGEVAEEFRQLQDVCPLLVLHNEDDRYFVKGSKIFVRTLSSQGVDIQSRIWASGGHGYGLRSEAEVKAWPEEMVRWFRAKGYLKA